MSCGWLGIQGRAPVLRKHHWRSTCCSQLPQSWRDMGEELGGAGLRLTIFSASWLPIEGGAEKQLRQLAGGLNSRGWHVEVLAGFSAGTNRGEGKDDNVLVHRIRPLLGRGSGSLPMGVELASQMLAAAPLTRPDVVIGSLVSGASLAAIAYAVVTGTPAVLRIGGRNFDRLMLTRRGRALGRFLVRGSSVVVVNAAHLGDQVDALRVGELPHVVTIRNGVGATELARGGQHHHSRSGPIRAIYYTNGGTPKNDPAFVRVVSASPMVKFRAVGKTDHLPDLPNLERRGWRSDVGVELEWADLVLNTSRVEGSPNFCIQGLAVGRPVLGFANAGILDLQAQFPNDVHVTPKDDDAAMCQAIGNRDWRSHKVTAEVRTIDDAAADWDAVLSSLVLTRHKRRLVRFGQARHEHCRLG